MPGKATTKNKLPKKIAGVKIPKALRSSGGAVAQIAQNPVAREIFAAALVAAAAALASNKKVQRATGTAGETAKGLASDTADTANRLGHAIAAAITSAAHRIYPETDDRQPAPLAATQAEKRPAKAKPKLAS